MISLRVKSTFIIKMTNKTITPLSAYKKRWCAITVIKKPILDTTTKQTLENYIDILQPIEQLDKFLLSACY